MSLERGHSQLTKRKSEGLLQDTLTVMTRTGSPSFPLPVQGSEHWTTLPCQKSENLEEVAGGECVGEKAQPHEKGCCSLTAFSDCFHSQDSAAPRVSALLVLGRTDRGGGRIFITLIRSYS